MAKKIAINTEHCLKDLTRVSATIMPLVQQILGKNRVLELEMLRCWEQIVGEELAQYSLPQKITFRKNEKNNGTLLLEVLSGAFAIEVSQRIPNIIEKVNVFFGYSAISEIKIIQIGNIEMFQVAKKNAVNVKKSLVTEQEDFYITQLAEEVKSSELRQAVERLGHAVLNDHKQQEIIRGKNN